MKKIRHFLFFGIILCSMSLHAQLKENSIATNFILKDLNGVQHDLYSYLDSGYTCILDFSATWCLPCWNYHESGALSNLYKNYGPGTNDNKIRVFFIEADTETTLDDLKGLTTQSQGNWITNSPYPIIDLSSNALNDAYNIAYFPTLYMVCPNRLVKEVDQLDESELWDEANIYCGTKQALFDNDASLISYSGDTKACDYVFVNVLLQNNGKLPLQSAVIKASTPGQSDLTYNWKGNLKTYEYEEIKLGSMALNANQSIKVELTSIDEFIDNNSITQDITIGKEVNSLNVTVKVVTDQYGSDTEWYILDPKGNQIASGGPYEDQSSPGEYPQPDVNVTLTQFGCYQFIVTDVFGDGICCDYGEGIIKVDDQSGKNLITLNDYLTDDLDFFKVHIAGNVVLNNSQISINPNPTNGLVNIKSNSNESITFELLNNIGQKINIKPVGNGNNWTLDMSNYANGSYFLRMSSGNATTVEKIVVLK